GRRTDLGDLGACNDMLLSADGGVLACQDLDVGLVLYDLRAGVVHNDQRGLGFVSTICAANGDQVRPFEASLREGNTDATRARRGDAEKQSIYETLRGRPWNPCDWRGLLAVFPNPRTGDGWFEGLRQWMRLVSVRYFGGRDYDCTESTFGTVEADRRDP